MTHLLLVLLAAGESEPVDAQPTLFGVEVSGGCVRAQPLLDVLAGVARADFETLVRLVDEEAAKRFDDVSEKPYQRAELIKELSLDRDLAAKIRDARKYMETATYCLDLDANNVGRVALVSGAFRLGMGNALMSDKLTATIILGNPDNGIALTVGAWKRAECWEEEAFVKPCGPVFRDMPKEVKAVVEDSTVQARWRWKGLPKFATGFMLVPWRGSLGRQKTKLLSIQAPSLEFFDDDKVLWTAK